MSNEKKIILTINVLEFLDIHLCACPILKAAHEPLLNILNYTKTILNVLDKHKDL